jgi:branched-chain amino acid transport system permease protein
MIAIDLALAGIAVGAVAALAGLGVLVTYRTTGVFNLASGGMAMLVAYVLWQLVRGWHWPLWVAAPLALLVVGPGLGLAAEWAIFRPLRRRGASASETLVATVGLLVLLLGVAAEVWGLQTRQNAPTLVPSGPVDLPGGATIDQSSLAQLLIAVVVGVALTFVARRTRAGLLARAVVDERSLSLLSGVRADRVAATGWALGGGLAGLAGALLAPATELSPYGLTLVVLETLAVVVVARLASAVIAIGAALALGIAQAELQQVQLHGTAQTIFGSVQSNLFVVALLAALLLIPALTETGTGAVSAVARRPQRWPRSSVPLAAVFLAAPLLFPHSNLRTAQQVPALALIFLSLMLLSGVAGQISLGAAGYGGVGALLTLNFMSGGSGLPMVPGPLALLLGTLGAGVLGFITGYPALRRSGLALALTTLAVGTVASRFVFEQPTFTSGLSVRTIVSGDRAFYAVELTCLLIGLGVVELLTHGPAGRALRAARDSPDGARASGVDVRALTLATFAVSAALAGLGGSLLVQAAGAFDAVSVDPLHGLLWFTTVVVAGADSAVAAILAAAFTVLIDAVAVPGTSLLVVGVLATLLGRLPRGLAGLVTGLTQQWHVQAAHAQHPNRDEPRRLNAAGRRLLGMQR